ncbi:MAG: hypothetical protein AC479_07305 [miscellaneous Crenarchaeota group-6 archaeon AD8-1]|nr:MAG: hypothetical protein AC479_07305 [miscellaneous Crenarchaeota group-6 archaeon AD8-1]
MDIKRLLKDRFVEVLIFAFILNVICLVLIRQLNMFVHGELYTYGLVFSVEWAHDFQSNNMMLWVFLEGASALIILSIIPHSQYSIKPSKTSKWLGFLLPTLALIYQSISIWALTQMNDIVYNRLYDFGIPPNFDWSITYSPLSSTLLALMLIVLIVLIIPAIRTLEIIEIEIVKEEEEISEKPEPKKVKSKKRSSKKKSVSKKSSNKSTSKKKS